MRSSNSNKTISEIQVPDTRISDTLLTEGEEGEGGGGGGDGNKGGGGGGVMTLGDHMPTPFVPMSGTGSAKCEPLLPTPPSTHMVKLDTTLTCECACVHTVD